MINISYGGLFMATNEVIFHIVGGISLFLLGIKFLSDGFQKVAGDRVRQWLASYSVHPLLGVLAGVIITILFQNSTGALILLIGLLNANLLNVKQGISVLIGVNLGTILTVFIVGIRIEEFALPMIAVGVFFLLFVHLRRVQYLGQIVIGFGMLFQGLDILQKGLNAINPASQVTETIVSLADVPMFGVLGGIIISTLLTSSNVAIGVLLSLTSEEIVTIKQAIPILIGSNIGTVVIAYIAVIGANIKAKRVMFIHALYHGIGALMFILLLNPVTEFTQWISSSFSVKFQLATVNGLFHIVVAIVFMLFIPLLAKLAVAIIQSGKLANEVTFQPQYLDKRFLSSPSIALDQALHEVVRMGIIARETLSHAATYFFQHDSRESNLALKKESLVNTLDHHITQYMVDIHQLGLTMQESEKATGLLHVVNDIERIGDHAENIVEQADYVIQNRLAFSDEALQQLKIMIEAADYIIGRTIYALEQHDRSAAADVLGLEADLDRMELEFRNGHFKRLSDGACRGNAGAVFLDLLSNLERVGDHSKNIAEYVLR